MCWRGKRCFWSLSGGLSRVIAHSRLSTLSFHFSLSLLILLFFPRYFYFTDSLILPPTPLSSIFLTRTRSYCFPHLYLRSSSLSLCVQEFYFPLLPFHPHSLHLSFPPTFLRLFLPFLSPFSSFSSSFPASFSTLQGPPNAMLSLYNSLAKSHIGYDEHFFFCLLVKGTLNCYTEFATHHKTNNFNEG